MNCGHFYCSSCEQFTKFKLITSFCFVSETVVSMTFFKLSAFFFNVVGADCCRAGIIRPIRSKTDSLWTNVQLSLQSELFHPECLKELQRGCFSSSCWWLMPDTSYSKESAYMMKGCFIFTCFAFLSGRGRLFISSPSPLQRANLI